MLRTGLKIVMDETLKLLRMRLNDFYRRDTIPISLNNNIVKGFGIRLRYLYSFYYII